MRFEDITSETAPTFLHCLHDERTDDPRVIERRRRWVEAHRENGFRGRVLVLDDGDVPAMAQHMPVEYSPFAGHDLTAILCLWVHGYEHHLGNRQGQGYGRLMLEAVEQEARESGVKGVVAWGMDFPYWNPVSFYEHMGYERVEKQGESVLVWKRFAADAEPPRGYTQRRRPVIETDKVSVMVFVHGWCTGHFEQAVLVQDAVEGLEDIVEHREVDTSDPRALEEWGIVAGVYLEGEPLREYEPPPSTDVIRQDIIAAAGAKGLRAP
jgi:GNAT superfamily N-acetyltransferase